MATELGSSVNGLYGGQYGQPAELAASMPLSTQASAVSHPTTESTANSTITDPQQVGWYFVEQYYTTLSKQPDRIHLFYSKKSQLVTGIEAAKVVPSVGQSAIRDKIKELDIQDCKVRVLNVDCQNSLNNIVVQVIGVMSNKSAPSKKYVQTFVLTPQTNGYYVLNDIFRYLNDEEDEIVEDEPIQKFMPSEQHDDEKPPAVDVDAGSVNNPASIEQVDAKLEEVANDDIPPTVNGATEEPEVEESVTKDISPEATEEIEPSLSEERPPEPEPTPAQSPPQTVTSAPAVDAPPSKKTWANLVGSKVNAVSTMPTPPSLSSQPKVQKSSPPASAPQPLEAGSTDEQVISPASQGNEWQTADHGKKQGRPQSKSLHEGNVLGYIKHVTEKIEASKLRSELERYGELKYFDVSRPRNCAFVEFATPGGYSAAVAANPHHVGSEQIYVEERRPRPNAFGGSNSGFSRGGGIAGRGRGGVGVQGRTASQSGGFPKDAGRGSFQQRGAKTGSLTPKGRGQSQAV